MQRPVQDQPIYEVEELSLVYPAVRGTSPPILRNVSFVLERGEALTIVGPSGSGKSSLLRCLNRLEEASGGAVLFQGRDVKSLDPRWLRRRSALVMQTPILFEGSVRENLLLHPREVKEVVGEGRVERALGEVGLELAFLDRDSATLSGGEKQRVTIARALLAEPDVLLLDEPTSALDPPNAALIVETITRLRSAHRLSIIAVTHQPDLVRRLGGMLLYLERGERVAYEPVERLAGSSRSEARLRAFLAGETSPAETFQ